ncbi:ABC transporter permease [Neptunomonas phycophila]|uniref:ABC transporter permease n=1 Tax=Neptunomonas phycophila TaxID=1572645 RepID=A0ABT9EYF0_9GAMM|nr:MULTISPECIES: ABC transporter permease [Neptunomonas]MDN2659035.1 ABC transporter permease [Neptunomonas sp. CHC150]MDP2523994.1 ABC transporter permease [Neptunomonas phycophila]
MSQKTLPVWVDIALIPLINVLLAFVVAAGVIVLIGENPLEAVNIMLMGAFGYDEGIGYTLYYTTNFIFTGLAVAIAFHAGLFNIGGEGQAYIGGLGVGVMCLALDAWLPWYLLLPLAIFSGALFGALWAYIPGYLQAYRGSHIVITTIMFNFIASALMVYLLVNVLIQPGAMSPESRRIADNATLPFMHEVFGAMGMDIASSPLNVSLFLALICCVFVWLFIWHTRWGYAIRMIGFNEQAAIYSGINTRRMVVLTMCISGGLAAMVGINEVMGAQERVVLDFVAGAGFTGIAVALMGRNHPVGIIVASLLFGALFQGGAELSFEISTITRDLVVVIQGLVILFCGALAYMVRPTLERIFARVSVEKEL